MIEFAADLLVALPWLRICRWLQRSSIGLSYPGGSRWYTVVIKAGVDMVSSLKDAHFLQTGPKFVKKISHNPLHIIAPAWTFDPRQDWSMLLMAISDPTIWMSQKSRLIRRESSNFGDHVWIVASVSCSGNDTSVCSAAVVHLHQGSTCCVFRDLSYSCFYHLKPVWSFSSTSGINKALFTHRTVTHWIFSFFLTFLCKPSKWLCVKIPVNHQSMSCSKPLKSPLFQILMLN